MSYADYSFYTDTYRGQKLSEADFLRLLVHADAYLDAVTFARAANAPLSDAIRLAACAVAEALYTAESQSNIKSESVGKYAVVYRDEGAKTALSRSLYAAAERFLSETGLLYSGC